MTWLAQKYLLNSRVCNNKCKFTEVIYIRLSSLNKLSKYIRQDNSVKIITAEIKLAKDLMDEISDDTVVALEEISHNYLLCIIMILNIIISSCCIVNP